jgi:hypothetical protein
VQTGRACYALYGTTTRIVCLPGDFLIKDGDAKFSLLSKVDEESYKIYQRFNTRNLDQEFLDRLFKVNNFQLVSASAKAQVVYGMTEVTLTPMNMAGAFKLINPSLPEVHMVAMTQQVARITKNFYFKQAISATDFYVAPSLYYAKRRLISSDFDILDTLAKKPSSLIEKRDERHFDVDLGFGAFVRREWWPSLTLRTENLLSDAKCRDCSLHFLELTDGRLQSSRATLSSYVAHPIGKSVLTASVPFSGVFSALSRDGATISYLYQLSTLGSFFAISPYSRSFGFQFSGELGKIGIQYSNEKQDNSIEIERQKRTNVFATLTL